MFKNYLQTLINQQPLTREHSRAAINAMLEQEITAEQSAALLVLLRSKRETADEILGVIDALQAQMLPVPTDMALVDIVGTGGDQAGTVNISTGAAILAASCGVPIAKHGNRSVSSACGSADVLEALGIDIHMPTPRLIECLTMLNIGFCFAPQYHTVLAKLRTIRNHLAIPTVLNMVGPFLNPAKARHLLLGVYSVSLLPVFADILVHLNLGKSVLVHGNGLDELSCCGATQVIEVENGKQRHYEIHPEDFGLQVCSIEDLKGGDAVKNAELLAHALHGKPGAITDTILLNAAMAIYLYGLTDNLAAALAQARQALHAGKAIKLLTQWQQF